MYQVDNKSTAHGLKTPHGFKTPHKFPSKTSTKEDLANLVINLYPTGRVWNMSENSNFFKLHKGLNTLILAFLEDSYATIDSSFPDNANFTIDDATLWEYSLGLTLSPDLDLESRKKAILRKKAFPQNKKARQDIKYIETQLNAAGFNVKLYENVFYDDDGNLYYKTPSDILNNQVSLVQHGGTTQHGNGTQHGGGNSEVIANSIQQEDYNPGGNLWATFFIAGNSINETAYVPKIREKEFRELVLKLKPAHLVAYLFINYV